MSDDTQEDYGPRLPFVIAHCSGEDDSFPVTELLRHTARTRGWQSAKMCEYPQEIGLRFDGDVDLRCVRLLSHESKITSKVDVYVARATNDQTFPEYSDVTFTRLGFMTFSSNEGSQFAARELKTARIRARCVYLKLVFRKCHPNSINIFNQVGLVALSLHGEVLVPLRLAPHHAPFLDTADHLRGSASAVAKSKVDMLDEEVPLNMLSPQKAPVIPTQAQADKATTEEADACFDAVTAKRIKDLLLHKMRAVAEEDYDLAKVLKEQIDQLRNVGGRIAELEEKKRVAVEQEDYDVAKALKRQIDDLRNPGQVEAHKKIFAAAVPAAAPMAGGHAQHQHPHASTSLHHSHPHIVDQPVGARGTDFDSRPAVAGAPAAYDDMPVGRGGPGGPTSETEAAPSRYAAAAPVAAAAPEDSHDEKPAVAKGYGNVDDIIKESETGGIVVAAKPAAPAGASAHSAVVSAPSMPVWERTFNELVVKAAGSDQAPAEALPGAKLAEFQQYVTVFGNYTTCCLFAKRWQLREAALRTIVAPAGFAALTNAVRPPGQGSPVTVVTTLLQYLNGKTFGVNDTIAQVFFAAVDAMKTIIREDLDGCSVSAVVGCIAPILPDLLAKAGDSNQRVREQATATLIMIAMSPVSCERVAQAAFAEPDAGASKKPVNPKIHLARLTTVQTLVEKVGLNRRESRTGLTPEAIVQRLCIPLLVHPSSDVREAAVHLVVTLNGMVPQAQMDRLLADVKPAQRTVIDEQILEAKNAPAGGGPAASESGPEGGRKAAAGGGEMEMASSSITLHKGGDVVRAAAQAVRKGGGAAESAPPIAAPVKPSAGGGGGGAAPASTAAAAPPVDPTKTCQFCGRYDKRFNDRTLDLHYVRSCPMLCPCPLCGQIAEIALLQEHLARECERSHLVRQCPMCREAIRVEEYDAHVSAKACIPHSASYNVCPLCHIKLGPGDKGWEDHLLKAPGCRNNPRRYDGGNGEEFA